MRSWMPDKLLRLLLAWTTVTLLLPWLAMVRSVLDGGSYHWGYSFWGVTFAGNGFEGDFWILPVETAFGIALLWLGWRGARQPFPWILSGWHGLLFSNALYGAIVHPENYRFRGDTLGIDVSLAWVGPLFMGTFFVLSVVWSMRQRHRDQSLPIPVWSRVNARWSWALLALLPVQLLLLRPGDPHGLTDKIGVILTIAQWFAISLALEPRLVEGDAGNS